MPVALTSNTCKCGRKRRRGQRNCHLCHRLWQRRNRKPHRAQTAEAKRRSNARAYLHVYIKRGKVIPQPCESCGSPVDVHGHHADYSKPLEVKWECRRCHLNGHGKAIDKETVEGPTRNIGWIDAVVLNVSPAAEEQS